MTFKEKLDLEIEKMMKITLRNILDNKDLKLK